MNLDPFDCLATPQTGPLSKCWTESSRARSPPFRTWHKDRSYKRPTKVPNRRPYHHKECSNPRPIHSYCPCLTQENRQRY